MNIDWILNPLTFLGALGAAMLACLALFVSTKAEISRLHRQYARAGQPEAVDVAALAEEVNRLNEAVRAMDRPPAPPAVQGINLTKRTQVIKMHSRGESVETMSAALQMPGNEIELILKLHNSLSAR